LAKSHLLAVPDEDDNLFRFHEKISRTGLKMLTWRVIMIIQYFFIGYYTTGSAKFGAGLAGFTTVVNSIIYFLHERFWNKTHWGRKVDPKL
jgi:uncharacterized membrane protein